MNSTFYLLRALIYRMRKLFPVVILTIASHAGASPLFDDDAAIDVELTGPVSTLIRKKKDRIEQPFLLRANGVEHEIRVRVRGKSRLRVCDFPPLRLNFSGQETSGTVFAGQEELKLVTHCRNRATAQTDALQEYSAYRIFNLLSDVSYKVRLLRIV